MRVVDVKLSTDNSPYCHLSVFHPAFYSSFSEDHSLVMLIGKLLIAMYFDETTSLDEKAKLLGNILTNFF